jgi:hypothetical protein
MHGRTISYSLFLFYSGKLMKHPPRAFLTSGLLHTALKRFHECAFPALSSTPKFLSTTSSPPFAHSIRPVPSAPVVHSTAASTRPPTTLDRKGALLHRLRSFYGNATRPFALSSPSRHNFPAPLGTASTATSSAILIDPAPQPESMPTQQRCF